MEALLGSKFDVRSFKAKNRVFKFDYQKMNKFKSVQCSKNDVQVRSIFDKMLFDPSLVANIEIAKNRINIKKIQTYGKEN